MVLFTCEKCFAILKTKQVDPYIAGKQRNTWKFTCEECDETYEGYYYDKKQSESKTAGVQLIEGIFLSKKRDEKAERKKQEKDEKQATETEEEESEESVKKDKKSKKDKKEKKEKKEKKSKKHKKDKIDKEDKQAKKDKKAKKNS